jgi:L-ascorbate metabolism protein UlaG (beta-lactamase superfamily)
MKYKGEKKMKITYLFQSGFMIEFESFVLLIDTITPPKADFKSKHIYFLASHSHPDHYIKDIFSYTDNKNTTYILSDDIKKYDISANVVLVREYEEYDFKDFKLYTFGSTDIGVSFYIVADKYKIFHSGDLNWWHWNEDTSENKKAMESEYKRHIENLSKHKVDIAFIPADPRLEDAYDYAMKYFIQKISPKIAIPMHFWDEVSVAKKIAHSVISDTTKIIDIKDKNSLIYQD